jgi:Cytochrome c
MLHSVSIVNKPATLGAIVYGVAAAVLASASSLSTHRSHQTPSMQYGQHIVESVAMCIQCHSPRDQDGKLIEGRTLMGAAIPFTSPFRKTEWALRAPRIAGLPGHSRAEGVRLLMLGIGRAGSPLQRPMPPFRMDEHEAGAVVDYLMSL